MSCDDCAFIHHQTHERIAIPCNSCQADNSDKGYCLASRSLSGYVPIVTKIYELSHAREIMERARKNGTELELLQWSCAKNAFFPTPGH